VLCYCDLDLDLMTFICEVDSYPLKMYPQTKNELSTTRLPKVIVFLTGATVQTDSHQDYYHDASGVIKILITQSTGCIPICAYIACRSLTSIRPSLF